MDHENGAGRGTYAIREATRHDAALLTDLGARLFEQTFGAANTADDMAMYLAGAFTESLQRAELADSSRSAWIAVDSSGSAIGYAMVRRGTTGDGIVFQLPSEVQRIYVDRAWFGRGVGNALMETCVADARGRQCDGIWLCVWERNPRAIAFYAKAGFQPVGKAVFVLGRDVQNDIVLSKPLKQPSGGSAPDTDKNGGETDTD